MSDFFVILVLKNSHLSRMTDMKSGRNAVIGLYRQTLITFVGLIAHSGL